MHCEQQQQEAGRAARLETRHDGLPDWPLWLESVLRRSAPEAVGLSHGDEASRATAHWLARTLRQEPALSTAEILRRAQLEAGLCISTLQRALGELRPRRREHIMSKPPLPGGISHHAQGSVLLQIAGKPRTSCRFVVSRLRYSGATTLTLWVGDLATDASSAVRSHYTDWGGTPLASVVEEALKPNRCWRHSGRSLSLYDALFSQSLDLGVAQHRWIPPRRRVDPEHGLSRWVKAGLFARRDFPGEEAVQAHAATWLRAVNFPSGPSEGEQPGVRLAQELPYLKGLGTPGIDGGSRAGRCSRGRREAPAVGESVAESLVRLPEPR